MARSKGVLAANTTIIWCRTTLSVFVTARFIATTCWGPDATLLTIHTKCDKGEEEQNKQSLIHGRPFVPIL